MNLEFRHSRKRQNSEITNEGMQMQSEALSTKFRK
jgi:hypothetical protein